MHGLRSADEAHRGEPEAIGVERALSGVDDAGVRPEPQIVVGAEVQTPGSAGPFSVVRTRAP